MTSQHNQQPVNAPADEPYDEDPRIVQAMERFLEELEAGRHPNRDEFLAKFPEIGAELAGQLEGLELLHGIVPQITGETSAHATVDDERLRPSAMLGDFRLLRMIGRGGMGVVYEAEQLSLGRTVAVKVLPFAAMLDDQHLKRFRNEARAAATLDHPNIVPIHFVGQDRGVHFYVMQLIEGQSLAEVVEDLRSRAAAQGRDGKETETLADTTIDPTSSTMSSLLSNEHAARQAEFFRSVAKLGIQAAEALEHAHQTGIVHRDIKPGNLLVEGAGKLWITDFGLASYEQGEALTQTGGIVGTLAYMSPEQAAGSRLVDGRSDIYSLGSTLCELLLMHRPSATLSTKSRLSQATPPEITSLRRSDSRIPLDLETIILKAMSLDPADRYATAQALADDLRRFFNGRAIRARRLSGVERGGRWLRRHRRTAAASLTASAIIMLGVIAALSVYSRTVTKHANEVKAALVEKELALSLAQKHRRLAEQSEDRVRRLSYRSDMQFAFARWHEGHLNDASRILERQTPKADQSDLRGLEWYLLNARVRSGSQLLGNHDGPATECVAFPDGLTVASAGEDGLVHLWDVPRRSKRTSFTPQIGPIHAMAISPDGRTLAIGGRPSLQTFDLARVYLLDAVTGKRTGAVQRHQTTIESVAFSPDGKLIAAGSRYERVEVSTLTGEPVYKCATKNVRNETVSFSLDGERLAFIVNEGVEHARTVILKTGEVVDMRRPGIHMLMWWPARQMLATSRWEYVDLDSVGRHVVFPATEPRPHKLTCIHFNKEGSVLVAGDDQGRLHWWNSGEENWQPGETDERVKPTRCLQAHADRVTGVCLAGGGSVSTCVDGSVTLVAPDAGLERRHVSNLPITSVEATRDGQFFLGCQDGKLRRSNARMENLQVVCQLFDEPIVDVDVTADGSRLSAVSATGRVCVLDTRTGDETWSISAPAYPAGEAPAFVADISDDGRWLASTGTDNILRVREVDTRREILSRAISSDGRSVAISPDGSLVAFGSDRVRVFDTASAKLVHESRAENEVVSLQFGPSGELLASGHKDGSTRILAPGSDSSPRILRGHRAEVTSLAFSRNGHTLVSFDGYNVVRLWDTKTGEAYGEIELLKDEYSGSAKRWITMTETHFLATKIEEDSGAAIFTWELGTFPETAEAPGSN